MNKLNARTSAQRRRPRWSWVFAVPNGRPSELSLDRVTSLSAATASDHRAISACRALSWRFDRRDLRAFRRGPPIAAQPAGGTGAVRRRRRRRPPPRWSSPSGLPAPPFAVAAGIAGTMLRSAACWRSPPAREPDGDDLAGLAPRAAGAAIALILNLAPNPIAMSRLLAARLAAGPQQRSSPDAFPFLLSWVVLGSAGPSARSARGRAARSASTSTAPPRRGGGALASASWRSAGRSASSAWWRFTWLCRFS